MLPPVRGASQPHQQLRREIGGELFLFGLGGIGYVVVGVVAIAARARGATWDTPASWDTPMLAFLLGPSAVIVCVGLWRCREWARRAGGILAIVFAVSLFASAIAWIGHEPPGDNYLRIPPWIDNLGKFVIWALIALDLLSPSMRTKTAVARKAFESARRCRRAGDPGTAGAI